MKTNVQNRPTHSCSRREGKKGELLSYVAATRTGTKEGNNWQRQALSSYPTEEMIVESMEEKMWEDFGGSSKFCLIRQRIAFEAILSGDGVARRNASPIEENGGGALLHTRAV